MSSTSKRLGRNPLKAPKKATKKTVFEAAKIVDEPKIEQSEAPEQNASEKFGEPKSSSLRESIARKQVACTTTRTTAEKTSFAKHPVERLIQWLLVDIPAESYVLTLKSVLLIKAVLE